MTAPFNPTKPTARRSLVGSQAGNRYTDTFFDQHRYSKDPRFTQGRPWCGPREMAAIKGMPDGFVGPLQCGQYVATGPEDDRRIPQQTQQDRLDSFATAWDAPWIPEEKYFEFQWRSKRITIRYDRVAADFKLEQTNYYRAANKIAAQRGWPAVAFGSVPSFQIESVLWAMDPKRSPLLPQAALAGDPWLLGFTDTVNVELARVLAYRSDAYGYAVVPQAVADVATPERVETVLNMDPANLAAMIEAAVEKRMEAERQKKRDQMAHARAAKKKKAVA